MGLFGNAEKRAQRKAERREYKKERVATRREFLGKVLDKGAGIAGLFAPSGATQEAEELNKAMGVEAGSTGSSTTEPKPGMPKWVIPAAIAGVLLFMFMGKKGRR